MSALGLLERSEAATATVYRSDVAQQVPRRAHYPHYNWHQHFVETSTATDGSEATREVSVGSNALLKGSRGQRRLQKPSTARAVRLMARSSVKSEMSSGQEPVPSQLGHLGRLGQLQQQLDWDTEVACCRAIQRAHNLQSSAKSTCTTEQQLEIKHAMQQAAEAKALLVVSCQRFIMYQARQLQAGLSATHWVPLHDMYLAGIEGLCNAALKYNPAAAAQAGSTRVQGSNKARFLSFARHYIAKAIRATLKDWDNNDVYIPRSVMDVRVKVVAAVTAMTAEAKEGGRVPSIRAVAARTGLRPRTVKDVVHALTLNLSALDETVDDDDQGSSSTRGLRYLDQAGIVTEQLSTSGSGKPSSSLAVHSLAQAMAEHEVKQASLQDLLSQVLSQRECLVVTKLMGLDGADPATAPQVAATLGISRQRVEQLHAAALKKLRAACQTQQSIACDLHEVCS